MGSSISAKSSRRTPLSLASATNHSASLPSESASDVSIVGSGSSAENSATV
jgi:hypothetical protein